MTEKKLCWRCGEFEGTEYTVILDKTFLLCKPCIGYIGKKIKMLMDAKRWRSMRGW